MKTNQEMPHRESKHLRRAAITAIAVAAVLAAVIIKAKLFGEFTWQIGW